MLPLNEIDAETDEPLMNPKLVICAEPLITSVPSKVVTTEPLTTPVPSKVLTTEPDTTSVPSRVRTTEPLTTPSASNFVFTFVSKFVIESALT